jgi:hypothetical protein
MSEKQVYYVGKAHNSSYSNLFEVPDEVYSRGNSTIMIYPGEYVSPFSGDGSKKLIDTTFMGIGPKQDVIIHGPVNIAANSAGTFHFENLTIKGENASSTGNKTCVHKLGIANAGHIYMKAVKLSNCEHGVLVDTALATQAAHVNGQAIHARMCEWNGVDQAIKSNANVHIEYSKMNASSNAYFTHNGSGAPLLHVKVLASHSGGSNTGNNTETIQALIS